MEGTPVVPTGTSAFGPGTDRGGDTERGTGPENGNGVGGADPAYEGLRRRLHYESGPHGRTEGVEGGEGSPLGEGTTRPSPPRGLPEKGRGGSVAEVLLHALLEILRRLFTHRRHPFLAGKYPPVFGLERLNHSHHHRPPRTWLPRQESHPLQTFPFGPATNVERSPWTERDGSACL